MIPLSVPSLRGNELKYVSECIETEWISSAGSFVNRFEQEIAQYTGASQAIACINGTAALHVSLILSGVHAGEEVIVPTLTFIAPVNAIRYVGAHPVFMDCDDHLNCDPEKLGDFLKKECEPTAAGLKNRQSGRIIKGIIVVHVFGHPVNLKWIQPLAETYGLKLIEDATESLGSSYKDWKGKRRATGTIGTLGCLSFNGNKLITTGGGGMILTEDEKLAQKARYLTTQAKDDGVRFVHHEIGYNYRLTNVQAAIGCGQLEQIERFLQTKRSNFGIYRECLSGVEGLSFIGEPSYATSNFWHYTLLVDPGQFGGTAEEVGRKLAENNIETRPIWALNHRQKPYQKDQAYKIEKAIDYHRNGLNLPCSVNLEPSLIEKICRVIKN